ncbi:hypothetical protein LUZ60_005395 [Juncus effusus]|nr:hypothetical protein LUZ60_005395 [Juncus effusus]
METRRGSSNGAARSNQVTPTHVVFQIPTPSPIPHTIPVIASPASSFTANAAKFLFFFHLLIFIILVSFLAIHGSLHKNPSFKQHYWYLPILSSIVTSYIASLLLLSFTLKNPILSFKTMIRLSPLLTCGVAIILLLDGTGGGLGFAMIFLALAIGQALYACWITHRLPHAYSLLSLSISSSKIPFRALPYVALSLLMGASYAIFWTLGIAGVVEDEESRFAPLYIISLLLSLAWTMHVIKYVVYVLISMLTHQQLTRAISSPLGLAFRLTVGPALGDVCLGAAIAPIVGATRGAARAMDVIAGGTDEFMFSCTSCFANVSDRMVGRGNRWGLVHVAAYGKGFGDASRDIWEMFVKQGMGRLVDLDLTGSFCFLCAMSGGSLAALTAGPWVLVVNKEYVLAATIYAFIIGYFMTRIATAWPQACVAAFHVAFAENPLNQQLGSCIQDRLRELGREENNIPYY